MYTQPISRLVSVVTPSYCSLPYIKESVESVRGQDYPHIEHIVVDGESTDGTREYLEQQSDLIWISEPDQGQSHALNKGFRLAKGDIIGWLNADDVYEPGTISTVVRIFSVNPDVDMVYSDLKIIDENSNFVGVSRSEPFDLVKLLSRNYIKQPTVFFRRSIIEALGGVNEQLNYVMDWEFWLRIGVADFRIHYLRSYLLAGFRLAAGSKTYEKAPNFHEEKIDVLASYLWTPTFVSLPDTQKHRIMDRARAAHHLSRMLQAIDQRKRKALFREFIRAVSCDRKLLTNRGIWFFLGLGVLGKERDRFRRFRKQIAKPLIE